MSRTTDQPDPLVARYVAEIVTAIEAARGGRSLRQFAQMCGVSASTLSAVIRGRRFPDLQTVVLVEAATGIEIWPFDRIRAAEFAASRMRVAESRVRPRAQLGQQISSAGRTHRPASRTPGASRCDRG